jgi:hypothetical protein
MSTIHFKKTTTATPEQFIAGLTDFGPGRSKLLATALTSTSSGITVVPPDADVTESSGSACTTSGPIPTALS